MEIRMLQEQELWNALNLCYQRSMDRVWEMAGRVPDPTGYKAEREAYFQKKLAYEEWLERFRGGQIVVFGAFEKGELNGAAVLDSGNAQILLLAAKRGAKEQETAAALLFELACFANARIPRDSFLVEAQPEEAGFYRQLRFMGNPQQMPGGVVYLYRNIAQILSEGRPKKKRTGLWIGLGIGAAVIVLLLLILVGSIFAKWFTKVVREEMQEQQQNGALEIPYEMPYNEEDPFDDDGDAYGDGEDDTVMGIEGYTAENIGYEAEMQEYQKESDNAAGYYIYFDIQYPELTGLPKETEGEINRLLKECAMQTEMRYYSQPTEEIKEWMLRQGQPIVLSQVRYNICYMTDDLICVVFEDNYAAGNIHQTKLDMRVVTIGIKDAAVYDVSDVLRVDDSFASLWRDSAKDSYPDLDLLADFRADEYQEMLAGEYAEKGVRTEMILTGDGIEIGFVYDYTNSSDEICNGYATIDFSKDELMDYQKNADFWNMVKAEK